MKKLFIRIISLYNYLRFRKLARIVGTVEIGFYFKVINKSKKKDNIIIKNNCSINASLISSETGKIHIGEYSTVRFKSKLKSNKGIYLGRYVIVSNNVTISDNDNHPISPYKRKKMCELGFYSDLWDWKHSVSKEIIIEDNVWIGEKSAILKGVRIGEGSIVAMHSIVTKNVPPYSIVAGNPAKIVKKINPKKTK